MSAVQTTQAEVRLQRLMDEHDIVRRKHEGLLQVINERNDHALTEVEQEHITMYREQEIALTAEIDQLSADVKAAQAALERSRAVRRQLAAGEAGVEIEDDGVVYRDFYTYARDMVLTREFTGAAKLAKQWSNEAEQIAMRERIAMLKRVPANTLSSNVSGLQPPQYIDQIFQVINKSRALVNAATRTTLERGQLTYPQVTTRPVVAAQGTQKTEAGNQGMVVGMVTATATTYLGGGDLSWQAINWSTPDALQLWFDLAAADYALKTEQDAAKATVDGAFGHVISSPIGGTADFATLMTAVGAGYSKVFADSGRTANALILAPDRFGYLLGLTSTPQPVFLSVNGQNIGPLNLIVSRGLDAGTIIVGDVSALLVAETAGAPVELRVVEPAIGGVEVGLIGAFEADVVDPGAFSLITTAS